jgi:hypothetical protein
MLIPKDPEDAKKMSWWKFVPEQVGMKEYFAGRFVPYVIRNIVTEVGELLLWI